MVCILLYLIRAQRWTVYRAFALLIKLPLTRVGYLVIHGNQTARQALTRMAFKRINKRTLRSTEADTCLSTKKRKIQ